MIDWTKELEDEIIQAIENGEGLRAWCSVEGRPSRRSVLYRQRENEEFCTKCERAREAAGELSAEEQNEIAQKCLSGEITPDVARVVLNAKQWRAAKLASKTYGEKQKHEIGGIDGKPIETKNMTEAEIDRRIAELTAKTGASKAAGDKEADTSEG